MSDPFCRNCGHSRHDDDPGTGDFCFAITPGPDGGLCGCESYDEAFEEDFEDCRCDDDRPCPTHGPGGPPV